MTLANLQIENQLLQSQGAVGYHHIKEMALTQTLFDDRMRKKEEANEPTIKDTKLLPQKTRDPTREWNS
jgi:hypothetical protein